MSHLRKLDICEQGNGLLSATILDYLKVPCDCAISILIENQSVPTTAANYRHIFAIIATKLSGEGPIKGQALPKSIALDTCYGCSLTLSPREKTALGENAPNVVLQFSRSDVVEFMQGVGSGVLPFSDLTSLTVKNGGTFDEAAWEALRGCTNVKDLSVSEGD